eukprot:1163958-Pyramimonas_sp.AAC.1
MQFSRVFFCGRRMSVSSPSAPPRRYRRVLFIRIANRFDWLRVHKAARQEKRDSQNRALRCYKINIEPARGVRL